MTDSEKLDLILSEMQDLKQRTTNIETSVTDIKLTLDNEIRVNTLENELRRVKERIESIA